MVWYGLMSMTVELYVPPLLALRASKRCQKDPGSVDSMCSSTILIPTVTEHYFNYSLNDALYRTDCTYRW